MRLSKVIQAVDAHAAGEPGRVIVGGVLDVPGDSMFDKMTWLRANGDDLRLRMVREPRGYPAANCNLILPSSNPAAAAGYVIMEQVEYPGMSGTNTMCVTTVLLETGMVPMTEPVTELTLESPAGLIAVRCECRDGKVESVTFRNVPAFATHLDTPIEVPTLGTVSVDVAYGGMFYVIAQAEPFGLRLTPDEGRDITRITELIKAAAAEQLPVVHPEQPGFAGSRSASCQDRPTTRRTRAATSSRSRPGSSTSRNPRPGPARSIDRRAGREPRPPWRSSMPGDGWPWATFFATRGSSGRSSPAASPRRRPSGHTARSSPTITGSAWITGFSSYVLDPTDPFPEGFTVGDIW